MYIYIYIYKNCKEINLEKLDEKKLIKENSRRGEWKIKEKNITSIIIFISMSGFS